MDRFVPVSLPSRRKPKLFPAAQRDLNSLRELLREYARGLDIDLCFQNFEAELANLPGDYAPPAGRLLLAQAGDALAGCVALRCIGSDICEMKRLYVRPAFRRHGLGRQLAWAAIEAARRIGYDRMRLDTLDSMKAAIALYQSLGFQRIEPYYDNPSGRAVFMEIDLLATTRKPGARRDGGPVI
jgi:ribosomal protein S18 acetylase RimI-like enzyme